MYDITDAAIIPNEILMSQELKKLGWGKTEAFATHHVYYGFKKKIIGITVFHPELGACECTHYLLDKHLLDK